MKVLRIIGMALLVAVLAIGIASAATFSPETCLKVSQSPDGLITVMGDPADVAKVKKLEQYQPDKLKGKPTIDNKTIGPSSDSGSAKTFQLNMDSLRNSGQRAFNFKGGHGTWLHISNPLVEVSNGLILEMSQPNPESEGGRGGAHFVFMSDGYTPLYPIDSGGSACRPQEVLIQIPMDITAPQKRIISTPDVGAGDNKVSVKGDNNDITPQKIQQKQKQKVSIKGNNNTVKQKQTQIGINAKTTGANSPVTIHINGLPTVEDETCIKCHTNVVKKTTTDKNGNVVIEQKIEQKKEVKK